MDENSCTLCGPDLCPMTAGRKYQREYGLVALRAPRASDTSAEASIGRRIQVQDNGCWIFRGRADRYGRATVNGHRVVVHRWVYETLIDTIPDGHDLHHRCLTPGCCNPFHCDPLTEAQHYAEHSIMRRPEPRSTRAGDLLEDVIRYRTRYPRSTTMTDQTPVDPEPVPDDDEPVEPDEPA